MLSQKTPSKPVLADCKVDRSSSDLTARITEKAKELGSEKAIREKLALIARQADILAKVFDIFVNLGEIKTEISRKCDSIAALNYEEGFKDSIKLEDYSKSLYQALLQLNFPESHVERLLDIGYDAQVWHSTALAHRGAAALQAKLDLLELGQQLGSYKVGKRWIVGKQEPSYIKTFVVTDKPISSSDWVKIETRFQNLLEKGIIEAAPDIEKFQRECRDLAAAKGRTVVHSGLVELWMSDVLEIVDKHYSAAIATIFSMELKPSDVELNSLSVEELLMLETSVDEVNPDCNLPGVATVVEQLDRKLRSALNWPIFLIDFLKKLFDGVAKKCPILDDNGRLNFTPWKSAQNKVIKGVKLKGEYLPIRLEEVNHFDKLKQRLNFDEKQFLQLNTQIWRLSAEKNERFNQLQKGLGRPLGKVKGKFVSIPWVSDVIEVLEDMKVEKEVLALICYDLNVFLEEYDFQVAFSKYKLNQVARELLRSKVDELAVINNRPVDPITDLVRPWKDDLYQAIADLGKDATKLLKKEEIKYSPLEVQKLVSKKTAQIQEKLEITQQKLEITEQRLSEEQTYREQLQHQYNSLQEQVNQMQEMINQLLNQQSVNPNGKGNTIAKDRRQLEKTLVTKTIQPFTIS